MNSKEAKEHLNRIRSLNIRIGIVESEYQELKNQALKSPVGSGSGKNPSSWVEKLNILIVTKEKDLSKLKSRYIKERDKTVKEILALPNDLYVKILYKRYIEFKAFSDICDEIAMDYTYTCRLHGNALAMFAELHK